MRVSAYCYSRPQEATTVVSHPVDGVNALLPLNPKAWCECQCPSSRLSVLITPTQPIRVTIVAWLGRESRYVYAQKPQDIFSPHRHHGKPADDTFTASVGKWPFAVSLGPPCYTIDLYKIQGLVCKTPRPSPRPPSNGVEPGEMTPCPTFAPRASAGQKHSGYRFQVVCPESSGSIKKQRSSTK